MFPIIAKTRAKLYSQAFPERADQPEAVPWVWYHSRSFASASTTELTFFDAVDTDKSITNMEVAGQLSDPYYFEVFYIHCDILTRVSALAVAATIARASGLDDIEQLVRSGRGHLIFTMAQKEQLHIPLLYCHSAGGITGGAALAGTFTATDGDQVAFGNNGIPSPMSGFSVNGSITIPPQQSFGITVRWPAVLTLVGGDTRILISLDGILHRRVL